MALDPRIKKALNEFHKSQPALNIDGLPAGKRGILLGDILEDIISDIKTLAAKLDVDSGVAKTDYAATAAANDPASELG